MTRRTWVYTQGGRPLAQPYEAGAEWTDSAGRTAPTSDLYMDGVRAPDGTDIGSRAKRKEYMRTHALADADDFKGTWAKAAEERARAAQGQHDKAARREAVARMAHQLQQTPRRK